MIEIFFDGGCRPINPGGTACFGFITKCNGNRIRSGSGYIGKGNGMTNNVAEYVALQKALEDFVLSCSNYYNEQIIICGDSQLVIKQLKGEFKLSSDTAKKYCPIVKNLIEQIECRNGCVSLLKISGTMNREAHQLAQSAYNIHTLKNGDKVTL